MRFCSNVAEAFMFSIDKLSNCLGSPFPACCQVLQQFLPDSERGVDKQFINSKWLHFYYWKWCFHVAYCVPIVWSEFQWTKAYPMSKKSIFFLKHLHFLMFYVAPALCPNENTVRTCSICPSAVREETMIEPKYTIANCHLTGDRMTFMVRWRVPGAFWCPNDLQKNRYTPWFEVNLVRWRSASSISTFQQPQWACKVENIYSSPEESIHWSNLV